MTVYDTGMDPQRNENITKLVSKILKNYDIRLRPNFGGKKNTKCLRHKRMRLKIGSKDAFVRLAVGDPLYIGMDITVASFDGISEVNMVRN